MALVQGWSRTRRAEVAEGAGQDEWFKQVFVARRSAAEDQDAEQHDT